MEKNKVEWTRIIELVVILFTIMGSTVPLFLHLESKTDAILMAIHQEIKDFHGRLCAIEERNKK